MRGFCVEVWDWHGYPNQQLSIRPLNLIPCISHDKFMAKLASAASGKYVQSGKVYRKSISNHPWGY